MTGLEKNIILGCFRILSFLVQCSVCKISQLRDTVALYGHCKEVLRPLCSLGLNWGEQIPSLEL